MLPGAEIASSIGAFYEARRYQPLWFGSNDPGRRYRELLVALRETRQESYRPAYRANQLRASAERATRGKTDRALAKSDLQMSMVFISLARDLKMGTVQPSAVEEAWFREPPEMDYTALLQRVADGEGVRQVLNSLNPRFPGFRRLQRAASRYQELAAAGGWPLVDDGALLAKGATGQRVQQVRDRLLVTGELPGGAGAEDPLFYDQALVEAVKRFQSRNGLKVDGIVGSGTRSAMNVTVEERLLTIAVNLLRWRWLPTALGDRHVRVNVPDYSLEAWDRGNVALRSRIVVGSEYDERATPIFSDEIEYIIINPYWNVPHSIVEEEIIPKLKEDPRYLIKNHFEVTKGYGHDAELLDSPGVTLDRLATSELRLRQKAGPWNSLGRIKFMLPNQYAIYLHDTPQQLLFDKDQRAFSHGCIRVERTLELADFALQQSDWFPLRIKLGMVMDERQRVDLRNPLPVHILYWTAFVDTTGQLQFRTDIYGHDDDVTAALNERLSQSNWLEPPEKLKEVLSQ